NAFLRVPAGTRLRPVLTGWFAEFDSLEARQAGLIPYPPGPGAFAGATYDPTSHYRAAGVFDFHLAHGLTAERLREISRRQVGLLVQEFANLDVDPSLARLEDIPAERRAGFLAIRTARAS